MSKPPLNTTLHSLDGSMCRLSLLLISYPNHPWVPCFTHWATAQFTPFAVAPIPYFLYINTLFSPSYLGTLLAFIIHIPYFYCVFMICNVYGQSWESYVLYTSPYPHTLFNFFINKFPVHLLTYLPFTIPSVLLYLEFSFYYYLNHVILFSPKKTQITSFILSAPIHVLNSVVHSALTV